MLQHISDHVKTTMDVLSAGAAVAVIFKWAPVIAAVLSAVWSAMRIYDWISERREKRREKRPTAVD